MLAADAYAHSNVVGARFSLRVDIRRELDDMQWDFLIPSLFYGLMLWYIFHDTLQTLSNFSFAIILL